MSAVLSGTGILTMAGLEGLEHDPRLAAARADLEGAVRLLAPRAGVILAREPLLDPDSPGTSDVDLLCIADVDRLLPERIWPDTEGGRAIDLIWLPAAHWEDLDRLAADGVIPHRILTSRVVHDAGGRATSHLAALATRMVQPPVQSQRIAGFLALGHLTVREIGVTWDFPALALFWLHMAYAAALAAMADALHVPCPNIYTRPMPYLRRIEQATGLALEDHFVRALRLDQDTEAIIPPICRIQAVLQARFPEPEWPEVMRSTTRYEYRYFLDERELGWRVAAGRELAQLGSPVAAVFYLRCWAYFLACIPLAWRRAAEGRDISFVRPARAVRPELEALCPEILDDLSFVLGGALPTTIAGVTAGLDAVAEAHRRSLTIVENCGIPLPALPEWRPHLPPPAG